MKCENVYCVYYKKGKCILKRIAVDVSGMCDCCILVKVEEEILEGERAKLLELYEIDDKLNMSK